MYSGTPLGTTHADKLATPQPTFDLGKFLQDVERTSAFHQFAHTTRNSKDCFYQTGIGETSNAQQALAEHILLRTLGGTGEGPVRDKHLRESLAQTYQKVKIGRDQFVATYEQGLKLADEFIQEATEKAQAIAASMRAAAASRNGR